MSAGGWFDPDAIEHEHRDADAEMASLEAAGRRTSARLRRMRALRAEGRLSEAAAACTHGWGYPLRSDAARNESDPRAGQDGWRCLHCGSAVSSDPWSGPVTVVHPCELEGAS